MHYQPRSGCHFQGLSSRCLSTIGIDFDHVELACLQCSLVGAGHINAGLFQLALQYGKGIASRCWHPSLLVTHPHLFAGFQLLSLEDTLSKEDESERCSVDGQTISPEPALCFIAPHVTFWLGNGREPAYRASVDLPANGTIFHITFGQLNRMTSMHSPELYRGAWPPLSLRGCTSPQASTAATAV
jgi:hypothetical protein